MFPGLVVIATLEEIGIVDIILDWLKNSFRFLNLNQFEYSYSSVLVAVILSWHLFSSNFILEGESYFLFHE